MASGAAIVEASDKVIEKGKEIAGVALEASAADIEFKLRAASPSSAPTAASASWSLPSKLRGGMKLPEGVPDDARRQPRPRSGAVGLPNGTHVAEVEIDPDTGHVEVVKYTMVGDFGTVINPLLVEGQSHGGVVAGHRPGDLRACRLQRGGPAAHRQLHRLRDCRAPATCHSSRSTITRSPAKTNVLGAKGCGEAGCAGSLPSVMNAISDALGGKHINMPATPERVWAALNG
jgi:carbon-monoxide dehydrogenase large subunit